jgi:hypothetical protein
MAVYNFEVFVKWLSIILILIPASLTVMHLNAPASETVGSFLIVNMFVFLIFWFIIATFFPPFNYRPRSQRFE